MFIYKLIFLCLFILSYVLFNSSSSYAFNPHSQTNLSLLTQLADANVKRHKTESLGWDWGEGLYLYALLRLDQHLKQERYLPYVQKYFSYHRTRGIPEIDWSDKCVPGLAALILYQKTKEPQYLEVIHKIVHYIKSEPRTQYGGLNHLGHFIFSYVYPESMWVDSLMMYGIFAAQWARFKQDKHLLGFAAEQPIVFSRVLQDPEDKLWRHAWKVDGSENIPREAIYWLRGNGWVMASIPEILDQLPLKHYLRPHLQFILNQSAQALIYYQDKQGGWKTVLNKPGQTYFETSGTALIAYGLLHSVNQGYLPETFSEPAQRAYQFVLRQLEMKKDGLSLRGISGPTMPYGFQGYSLVPQGSDITWGIAATILAGLAFENSKN